MPETKGRPYSPEEKRAESAHTIKVLAKAATIFIDNVGINYKDGFQGLDPKELEVLGLNILKASSVPDGYDLLSQGDPSYYDRLIAEPQHFQTYKILDHTIRTNEPQRVERAIDVAARDLQKLQDLGRYMKSFETQKMDALSLDSPDDYFDIAVSNALTHYFTYEEQEIFYRQIHRILKPVDGTMNHSKMEQLLMNFIYT